MSILWSLTETGCLKLKLPVAQVLNVTSHKAIKTVKNTQILLNMRVSVCLSAGLSSNIVFLQLILGFVMLLRQKKKAAFALSSLLHISRGTVVKADGENKIAVSSGEPRWR